ncbi:ABC transporter substrate-binding protein [Bacillus horti]|uniref:Peptide/nickel transport system substrate-binding protein n=1 Tax=Caldalkalibacillus horti TaxID=77523 RepID=A0ABT9VY62_9BACI|nr:ABC transporter substrate-binding protein [Bacillus horti]MDQ0165936.1 peptide/nickel transport system substrate-binding protein [Bacillus horti]
MRDFRFFKTGLILILMLVLLAACSSGNDSSSEDPAENSDIVDEERVIRPIEILTRPQASSPDEFETANLIKAAMEELGLTVNLNVSPWEKLSDVVWYERDKWDIAGWQMAARPERLDPDEFIYNLFHSQNVEDGYNFIGYVNQDYDSLAVEQRVTVDRDERQQLVHRAQEILAEDVAYFFTVNPMLSYVFNSSVFEESSLVEMAGLGIKNYWTYINIEPTGTQRDMILNSNDTVQAINPLYISGSVDSWVTELIWDRLMRVDEQGLPTPSAAESVEWVTDTEIKVTLREGMQWHDGQPVTAEDVKFSFEVPLSGEVPMYKPFVDMIYDIEIEDERTLTFFIDYPWAAFETASLAKINLVPKHIWEPIIEDLKDKPENAESHQEANPIGSGPFKYADWKFGEEVVLEAVKDHYDAPKIDRWIVRIIPNMEASLGMLQTGEINFLAAYTGDSQVLEQRVNDSADLTMISSVDLGFRFFAPNHRRAPLDDKAFRRAVASVINRDIQVAAVWKGFAVPSDSVVSPSLEFWKNPNLNYPSGGVEEAKQILQEAGYEWDKNGKLLYPQGQKEQLGN